MVQRFVDRLVGVLVLDVLADDGDGHFVGRVDDALHHRAPVVDVQRLRPQAELLDDQLVQLVLDQAERHLVDAEGLVALLDDGARLDVAEQGDLLGHVLAQLALGAADEDVGLNADLPQSLDGVLRRLGLGLAGRLEVGDQRQVDVQAVVLADVEGELADRFEERQALDVADGAADLGDDHVHVVGGQLADGGLDLVGDVRDDLDGVAEVVAAALLLDDRLVDLAGGVVAVAAERGVGEAFVMAEVEVGFGAVVEDVDLAVLVGAHRAGIDVDVGVELLQADAQAAMLQQHADGGGGQPLAEGTDDAAGDEDVLGLLVGGCRHGSVC